MSIPPPRTQRLALYHHILKRFLDRLSDKPPRIHVPEKSGLRRPYPGMTFHLTPELFMQENGRTEFVCPSDRFDLKKSEMALIPRGVPHGEKAFDGNRAFQGLVACFHETNRLILIVSKKSGENPAMEFSDHFDGPEVSAAIRYLDDASAISPTSPTAKKQREALVFTCLASIQDLLLSGRAESHPETGPNPKVSQCRELIRAYLNNPNLSASDLARQMGCTADHLSRCFRREIGMSLFEYLRQERLFRARDLLQHPDLNISEIAWACGFNSLNYFVRSFRRTLGRSPGKYRRSLISGSETSKEKKSSPRKIQTFAKIRSKTSSGRSAFKTGRPKTT
jgi:AraC-like DNA-binding protein